METRANQSSSILDIDRALERVGGDLEFLLELVGIFRAACTTLMDDTREAVACGDIRTVEKTAHLFRAAADNVSAISIYDAALQLETIAQTGRLQRVQEACQRLEHEIDRLSPRLAALENALWFPQC